MILQLFDLTTISYVFCLFFVFYFLPLIYIKKAKSAYEVITDKNGNRIVRHKDDLTIPQLDSRKIHYTSSLTEPIAIVLSYLGYASIPSTNIARIFDNTVIRHSNEPALKWEDTSHDGNPFVYWTWEQYSKEIKKLSSCLLTLGHKSNNTIGILGTNSKEWFCIELATIYIRGIALGIYPTNNDASIRYVLIDTICNILFVDDINQLKKVLHGLDKDPLSYSISIIVWDWKDQQKDAQKDVQKDAAIKHVPSDQDLNENNEEYISLQKEYNSKDKIKIYSWNEFVSLEKPQNYKQIKERSNAIQSTDTALLIYTSGTTTHPKGCMLTHDNIIYSARISYNQLFPKGKLESNLCVVSYLPLSHVAAQQVDLFMPMILSHDQPLTNFYTVLSRKDALKKSLFETVSKAQPKVFFGVPRIWEKLMENIIPQLPVELIGNKLIFKLKKKKTMVNIIQSVIIYIAMYISLKRYETLEYYSKLNKSYISFYNVLHHIISKPVIRKIHKKIGLSNCNTSSIVAAAPSSKSLHIFFQSLNINLLEGWGMSETAGICSFTREYSKITGTVGLPVKSTELMVIRNIERGDNVGQGELYARGRQIFKGYLNDKIKTTESFTPDGWLRTGDLACISDYGVVSICGRIKNILITSGGENVAPAPIEDDILANCSALSNCIVIGDKEKYLTLLVTLKTVITQGKQTDILMDTHFNGSNATTIKEAQNCKYYLNGIQKAIDLYNTKDAQSNAQKIQKFRIIDEDFTVENNCLTPSLKTKRFYIVDKYKNEIDDMYQR